MEQELCAIDIQALANRPSVWIADNREIAVGDLPTCYVPLRGPTSKSSAVLSWRWDLDEKTRTSRNVSLAVEFARRTGIRYLFMDLVTVDQTLRSNELAKSVANLSSLYKVLPVIAAYDERHVETWRFTMRRPWIMHEVRSYWNNPYPITYLGYVSGQGSEAINGVRVFPYMLNRVWNSSFTDTVLMVLGNQINMPTIADFQHLMPEHARVIRVAFDKFPRNDYLLTVAILAQFFANVAVINKDLWLTSDLKVYSFKDGTLSLQGKRVATLSATPAYVLRDSRHSDTGLFAQTSSLDDFDGKIRFRVMQNAEWAIWRALGLSRREYIGYALRRQTRRRSLVLTTEKANRPTVTIFRAETTPGCFAELS
jgi:hypothetical protein